MERNKIQTKIRKKKKRKIKNNWKNNDNLKTWQKPHNVNVMSAKDEAS